MKNIDRMNPGAANRPGCLIFIIAILFLCFTSDKQYAMKFTQPEIIKIYNVVEQSNAPHNDVREVQGLFNRELKPYIDSTGRLK